jgi:hypothetical protein
VGFFYSEISWIKIDPRAEGGEAWPASLLDEVSCTYVAKDICKEKEIM